MYTLCRKVALFTLKRLDLKKNYLWLLKSKLTYLDKDNLNHLKSQLIITYKTLDSSIKLVSQ